MVSLPTFQALVVVLSLLSIFGTGGCRSRARQRAMDSLLSPSTKGSTPIESRSLRRDDLKGVTLHVNQKTILDAFGPPAKMWTAGIHDPAKLMEERTWGYVFIYLFYPWNETPEKDLYVRFIFRWRSSAEDLLAVDVVGLRSKYPVSREVLIGEGLPYGMPRRESPDGGL